MQNRVSTAAKVHLHIIVAPLVQLCPEMGSSRLKKRLKAANLTCDATFFLFSR